MAVEDIFVAAGSIPGISGLIKIGQVAGVVVIAYILFLILKGILQMKQARRLGKLVDNVMEINDKMDKLIKLNSGKYSKKAVKKK